MILRNRAGRTVPVLNTASLPDLIFTVLFFFIVATHMRTVTLKVYAVKLSGAAASRSWWH